MTGRPPERADFVLCDRCGCAVPPARRMSRVFFRFYEELNDFLSPARRKRTFMLEFTGERSVKDAIEALGVPHTEVDLILVDGRSVGFRRRLKGGERVAVYPVFESLDITPLVRLRRRPLRRPRFILDVHLGKLARLVRLMGFDASYRNDYADEEIIRLSLAERRIILTRDRGILKHRSVTHGCWLRSFEPRQQLREVMRRFDLARAARPFTRCLDCNGRLRRTTRRQVLDRLPPVTREVFREFRECAACRKVYWQGSHYEKLRRLVAEETNGARHTL